MTREEKLDEEGYDALSESEKYIPPKTDFNSLQHKNDKRGKLDKKKILYTLLFLIVIFSLCIYSCGEKKKKKINKESVKKEKVITGEFNPDFGDYKEREYKPSKEEKEIQNLKEVEEELLSIDDNEYITPKSKKEEDVSNTYKTPSSSSSQSYYNSTNPEPKNEDKASLSSIRYVGEGFGYKDKNDYATFSSSKNSEEEVPHLSDEEIAKKYLDRMSEVSGKVSDSSSKNDIRYSDDGLYEPNKKGGDISKIPLYSLYPGTIIKAVLVNGINTDYPGTVTARVISNVYDSKTGQVLLIPSGSILRGRYSSSVDGVSRIQIAWESLIINRDYEDYIINLGSMVGEDDEGMSGVKGKMNDHPFENFKAFTISALNTVLHHNVYNKVDDRNPLYKDLANDMEKSSGDVSSKAIDKALNIAPTVTVKSGTRINVDVDKVLTLIPYKRDFPYEKYKL